MIPSESEKNWARVIHLSALLNILFPPLGQIAPIVLWVVKRGESRFLDQQGKEAANLALTTLVIVFGLGLIAAVLVLVMTFTAGPQPSEASLKNMIPAVACVGFMVIAILYSLIASIIAAAKVSDPNPYRHRLPFRLIR